MNRWVDIGISCMLTGATGAILFTALREYDTAKADKARSEAALAAIQARAVVLRCLVRTCTPGTLTGAVIMDKGGIVEVEPCPETGRVMVCGPVSSTPFP